MALKDEIKKIEEDSEKIADIRKSILEDFKKLDF